jgi:selenocysteine lyase/cysteine desulfurase
LGVDPTVVSTGATASQLVALIAGSLPPGSRAVVPENEFVSLSYPFLAHRDRGMRVEAVRSTKLVDAVASKPSAAAFSLVASNIGELMTRRRLLKQHGHRG